jgi:tetratricopeptide (TPR) repeat protein
VLAAVAAPAGAQPASEYEQLVLGYAHGAVERAALTLAAWPAARVTATEGIRLAPAEIKAAAMLHTDTAFALSDPKLAYLHLDRARALLESASDADRAAFGLSQFADRWYALEAIAYTTFGDTYRADGAIRDAVFRNADNRDIRLVAESLRELNFRLGRFRPLTGDRQFMETETTGTYGRIVAQHPDFLEARLRFARALFLNHSPSGPVREQLQVVVTRSQRRDLLYLAHLFLGRLEENDGHAEAAAHEYEAAQIALPRQTSFVALMQAYRALGREADAERLAAAFAEYVPSSPDPMTTYNAGLTGNELVEWLHNEARLK